MDLEPLSARVDQPALFDVGRDATGALELMPAVWSALEDLTSPEIALRRQAASRLAQMKAHRLLPLVAYVFATRLVDSDLALRSQVVASLAEVFTPDSTGKLAPLPVRRHLSAYLAQIRERQIICLLEVSAQGSIYKLLAARLLNACPYAGSYLVNLLSDRKISLAMRREAIEQISLVGYLEAITALERLEARLAGRASGQQQMPFAPPVQPEEMELLPALRQALASLKTP